MKVKTLTMEQYNVTGALHGSMIYANNPREAKRIFRRNYKHEKIIYCGIWGRLKLSKKHFNYE